MTELPEDDRPPNSVNLEFEKLPVVHEALGKDLNLETCIVSGGVVIKATVIEVPGLGWRPALVYQFYTAQGLPLQPIVFMTVVDNEFLAIKGLTYQATNAAMNEMKGRINGAQ